MNNWRYYYGQIIYKYVDKVIDFKQGTIEDQILHSISSFEVIIKEMMWWEINTSK